MNIDTPLIAIIASVFTTLAVAYFARRKTSAEADVSVSTSWKDYVTELKTANIEYKNNNAELKLRIDELESIVNQMQIGQYKQEELIKKLQAQVQMLEAQLLAIGQVPFTQTIKRT